ncbi:hypothetical protein KXS05_02415 [Rhizobium sp. SA279]
MNISLKTAISVFLGSAVGTAAMLIVLFGEARVIEGESGGDALRNFIYDFQTLITGGLAVLAAFFTIRYAIVFDGRQYDRHQQMMAFTIRRELQTLERAFHPQVDEYVRIADRLWHPAASNNIEAETDSWSWFTDLCTTRMYEVKSLRDIIDRQQFQDGLPYFDGRLSRALTRFIEAQNRLYGAMLEHMRLIDHPSGSSDRDKYVAMWRERINWIGPTATVFVQEARALMYELLRAQGEYSTMADRFKH